MEDALAKLSKLAKELADVAQELNLLNAKKTIEYITDEQRQEILHLCSPYPDVLQDMLDRIGYKTLSVLPKAEYRKCIERLRKIVDARKAIDGDLDEFAGYRQFTE
jgi:hypothetical protein